MGIVVTSHHAGEDHGFHNGYAISAGLDLSQGELGLDLGEALKSLKFSSWRGASLAV